MESIVTRVTSKGQVVIPKKLRQKYAIVTTTLIRWIDKEDDMLMVPEACDPIHAVRGMLQSSCRLKALLEAKAVENERELHKLGLEVIICGAVSDVFFNLLHESDIELVCGIAGDVDDVIDAYCNGALDQPRFRMPGSY